MPPAIREPYSIRKDLILSSPHPMKPTAKSCPLSFGVTTASTSSSATLSFRAGKPSSSTSTV